MVAARRSGTVARARNTGPHHSHTHIDKQTCTGARASRSFTHTSERAHEKTRRTHEYYKFIINKYILYYYSLILYRTYVRATPRLRSRTNAYILVRTRTVRQKRLRFYAKIRLINVKYKITTSVRAALN